MFPTCGRILAFIQPLMPALDFEHAISLLCHYAIMQGRSQGAFQVLNKQQGTFITEDEEMLKAVAAQAAIAICQR